MDSLGSADLLEIQRYDRISETWWDTHGEMRTLHTINPLRMNFIQEGNQLKDLRILDVGCGGGILTEALAKAGAQVTGIDLSQGSLAAAKRHAHDQGLQIDYRFEDMQEFAEKNAGSYHLVTCMEMLEHVLHPEEIIAACARVLLPGGQAYFSSINRTLKALLFAILIGEYMLHLLPRGSHKYSRLIRPKELIDWAERNNLAFIRIASLMYHPLSGKFKVAANKEDVNYMAQFIKRI
jgi:2-polyprenyl-6-hydroxyphenyl methylase/3-demethylubiquinone-9 3-methyltransferase